MNRLKKIMSLLLSVCLLASMLTGVVSAASGSNVSFTGVPTSEVEVGETLTVTIKHGAANLVAAGLYLEFDKTKLECTAITAADGTEGLGMYYEGSKGTTWADATVADTVTDTNKDGIFSLGVAGSVNGSDFADQIVAIITFKAIASGEVKFTLNENSSGTDDFKGVSQTATLNIVEAPVPVTGVSIPETLALTYGGVAQTLTANVAPSGASDKSVTWSVAPAGVVTIDTDDENCKVTPVKVGTATITVTTADGNFTDTCTVTVAAQNITITKDDITIADAGEYTGSAKEPAVTVKGLSAGDYVVQYSNNTNAGAASVTVSPAPNSQYTFAPVTKEFTIAKADQNISADNITAVVGAGEITFNFQAKSDITISVDGTVPAGTTVDLQAKKMTVGDTAGTFKLTLNAAETNNYNAATKQITVTISEKTNANVSFNNEPTYKTYGDAAFSLDATAANTGNNGAWTWTSNNTDVLTVNSTGKVTVVGAGKATITAKYESDTTIGSATVEITVNKAEQRISGQHITLEVGESVDLSNLFSAQGTLSYSITNGASISGTILTAGNTPGTYALAVTAAETANYKAVTRGYDVTITEEENDDPVILPIIIQYTLTFETNGGSTIAPVKKLAGSTVNLNNYVPTKTGYEFAGWYTDKALTDKVTSVKLTKNMTVYAKWTEIPVVDEPCDGGKDCITYSFTDVDQSQWYHEGIDFVVANDMMKGVGNNQFDPHGVTSRAMIVTILYRLEGEPTVTGANPFSDVENGTWYTDAVIWAEANGIVSGYGDGKFGPDDDITREQMAKIMYNYAEYKDYDVSSRTSLASFSDAGKISSWATEEMQWAVAVGLINGMGDGTVAPQGDAERCQVAAIFMRFCDKYVK